MTLRRFGRGSTPLHDDYVYVFLSHHPAASLTTATIGAMADPVESGLSDHAPVAVELAPRRPKTQGSASVGAHRPTLTRKAVPRPIRA